MSSTLTGAGAGSQPAADANRLVHGRGIVEPPPSGRVAGTKQPKKHELGLSINAELSLHYLPTPMRRLLVCEAHPDAMAGTGGTHRASFVAVL